MFAKDLFFNVFNIINIENKVNAKYKTKNNKTEGRPVFFASINQTRANTISDRSLVLTATRLYNVWFMDSFFCPLKKIISVTRDINAKTKDKMARSLKRTFILPVVISTYPKIKMKVENNRSTIYLKNFFNIAYLNLMKSLIAI